MRGMIATKGVGLAAIHHLYAAGDLWTFWKTGRLADWEVPSSDPGPGPVFLQLIVDRSADGLTGYVSAGRLLRNDDDDKRRGRDKTKRVSLRQEGRKTSHDRFNAGPHPGLRLGGLADFSVSSRYFHRRYEHGCQSQCRTPQLRELPKLHPY